MSIHGRVVGVIDGDTIDVLPIGGDTPMRIRLASIDAPESHQDFGSASKKALAALCFQRSAAVSVAKKDKYGRYVGDVSCDGQSVSAAMVSSGMAWVYTQYSHDAALLMLERNSRQSAVGLWSQSNPVPPWEFRRQHK